MKTGHNAAWQRKEMHTKNGGGGIRTPETVTRLTVFKTVAFSRSATPPEFRSHAGPAYAAAWARTRRCVAIYPARTIFGDDIELSSARQPGALFDLHRRCVRMRRRVGRSTHLFVLLRDAISG